MTIIKKAKIQRKPIEWWLADLRSTNTLTVSNDFISHVKSDYNFKHNFVRITDPKSTTVAVDILLAETMAKLLGSRKAYVVWVQKAYKHIKSSDVCYERKVGMRRLIEREALAFILTHIEK